MKLLVVSNMYPSEKYPSYGVFVENFCKQLTQLEIDYSLAVMKKSDGKVKKLLGYVRFFAQSFFKSLFGKYDAVYVHYASHSTPGVLWARKFRKFTIYTNCHGSDVIPENAGQERMQKNTRAILSYSKKVIVPSEYFKQVVADKYAIAKDRIFVCASGGVDTSLFRILPDSPQRDVFTMGYVGRLSYGKGWDTMLRACAMLPDRNYRLLVVGDGPEKPQMLSLLEELDLGSCTELCGLLPQKELVNIYNNIDVFLFPTERAGESLGLVAVEAMACGTPVIASDFAAPAYYTADGVNGYKFEMGNPEALAQKIQQLRNASKETRETLSAGALRTALAYSREEVTRVLGKILLE